MCIQIGKARKSIVIKRSLYTYIQTYMEYIKIFVVDISRVTMRESRPYRFYCDITRLQILIFSLKSNTLRPAKYITIVAVRAGKTITNSPFLVLTRLIRWAQTNTNYKDTLKSYEVAGVVSNYYYTMQSGSR